MSRWQDDDKVIAVQSMVISFSWEKQVSVAPKDVYRPSIFFFPTPTPLRWRSINLPRFIFYHALSTDFEEKIGGVITGYWQRLWQALKEWQSVDVFDFIFDAPQRWSQSSYHIWLNLWRASKCSKASLSSHGQLTPFPFSFIFLVK